MVVMMVVMMVALLDVMMVERLDLLLEMGWVPLSDKLEQLWVI